MREPTWLGEPNKATSFTWRFRATNYSESFSAPALVDKGLPRSQTPNRILKRSTVRGSHQERNAPAPSIITGDVAKHHNASPTRLSVARQGFWACRCLYPISALSRFKFGQPTADVITEVSIGRAGPSGGAGLVHSKRHIPETQ